MYDDMLYGEEYIYGDEADTYDDDLGWAGMPLPTRRGRAAPARRGGMAGGIRGAMARPLRRGALVRPVAPSAPLAVGRPLALSPVPPLVPQVTGVPNNSALYIPFGLGVHSFVNAAPTTFRFRQQPEKPLRPRRLWISVARTGASATALVSITDIKVGTRSMLGGSEAIPAEQFQAGAFDNMFSLFDSIQPGVSFIVDVAITAAPGAGDSIDVSASVSCDSLG